MKENWLKIFLKGLCVGGTMLVPGVSGGSMAMILGIYDKLITSVSSFFACKKRNALFLLLFALGGGAGMLLFANPLLYLPQRYPLVLRWFFIGAVAGSTPMMLKKSTDTQRLLAAPRVSRGRFQRRCIIFHSASSRRLRSGKSRRADFDLRRPGRGCCTCSSGHQRILSSSHDGHVQYSHPIHQPPLSALSAPSWCGRAFGDYTND